MRHTKRIKNVANTQNFAVKWPELKYVRGSRATQYNVKVECFQANSEEKLINKIHESFQQVDFILINPAAYTHTSVALRDALLAVSIPFVEIHLSNVHKREPFRHHSYFSDVAEGVICGVGAKGYEFAFLFAIDYLAKK